MKILSLIIGYLIGSISTAYLLVKHTKNIDIRTVGSQNAGATNVLRVAGKSTAVLVFLLDVCKGIAAVMVGRILGGETTSLWCGVAAIVGHNWPIYFGLKGGKGSATSLGVIWATVPTIASIITATGIITVLITYYVSLGSIVVAPLFPILMLAFKKPKEYFIFAIILMILTLYRHRSNIIRLREGRESKLGQKLK